MTRPVRAALLAAFSILALPPAVDAGTLRNACLKSDREAATRQVCSCIQQVADQNLTRSDQKLAASFFKDPDKAQEIRQSDNRNHERFWERYKEFGTIVEASCAHLQG